MSDSTSLAARLLARRDATAHAVRDALTQQLAGYAGLATPKQQGLLLDDVHYALCRVLEHSAADEPNTADDLEFFAGRGERAGRAGFPFADLVAAFDVVQVVAMRDFWQVADRRNYQELWHLSAWSAREVPRATDSAVAGYVAARSDDGDPGCGHDLVIKRLVEGGPVASIALAAGITLPPSYLVLLCTAASPARLDAPQRRLRDCVQRVPGALLRGDPRGQLILLPADGDPHLARTVAADLVASIAQLAGQPIHAAQAHRPTLAQVPDALAEAQQVLTLLCAMPGTASRPYAIDEMLVELAIARSPDIAGRLAAQLEPLNHGTGLHETLQTLFACDLDRARTADALHIHRRTLSYRLRRIQQLCGLDPATAHGIQLLRAALTASRLSRP